MVWVKKYHEWNITKQIKTKTVGIPGFLLVVQIQKWQIKKSLYMHFTML